MKYLSNFSNYITEKRDHTKTIKKFCKAEQIIYWANELDSNIALWLANQLVIKLKSEAKKRGISDDKIKEYLDGTDETFLYELVKQIITTLNPYFRKVLDYVNSPLHDVKPNINKLNLNDAIEKSDKWHKDIEKYQGEKIEDEKGEIILTFTDGFYWIDLQTTKCETEAKSMGHCGTTTEGTTILSLRKKQYPYITISYDENKNKFTQIKGRGNKKPVERYHKYIVDLIIKLNVQSFKSEYDRSSDFLPDDLNNELYTKLNNENPEYIENSKGYTEQEMRDMYYDEVLSEISEYAFMFPSTFINNINNDKFMSDIIDNEIKNSEIENIPQDDLINYIKQIIPNEKYIDYLELKIDNDNNLTEEEKLEEKNDIYTYLENLKKDDLIEMINYLNYNSEIITIYITERYKNYTAEDYIIEIYGTDYIEINKYMFNWLYEYLNDKDFAKEISENEDSSFLEERYNY